MAERPRDFGGGGGGPKSPPRSDATSSTLSSFPSSRSSFSSVDRTLSHDPDYRRRLAMKVFLDSNGFYHVNEEKRFLGRITYPLHCAVRQKDVSMVRLLLLMGANPSKHTTSGKTAEDIAKRNGYDEIVQVFEHFKQRPELGKRTTPM
ncbi:unnamed protein product [Polarella glacialis]|uniref:Uncharacterized protein n=2 Tax=Polarella glacialis TaxID=89957 RepID=A0A813M812_POLGL|nr:unnamed protein product [Polarella glacialis]